MCLFGSETENMKNFGEKMGKKTFFIDVWLKGGEGKKLIGLNCFLSTPTKMFFFQNREKTE